MRFRAALFLLTASLCSSPAADPSASPTPVPKARESGPASALPRVSPRTDWRQYLGQSATWFASDAARVVASNVLSHQSLPGAWPKNTNTADRPFSGDRESIRGTWDNGATVSEVRFLARAFEPASLSGAESAGILRFLMRLEQPTPEVREAVRAGAEWFASHPVRGIRVVDGRGDRVAADLAAWPWNR